MASSMAVISIKAVRSATDVGRLLVLVALLGAPASLARDRIHERTILGDWCAASGTAFHEEFSLAVEGEVRAFSSWLHQRPALSGTWELKRRTLIIYLPRGRAMTYRIVSATTQKLVLQRRNERREVYSREKCVPFERPSQ